MSSNFGLFSAGFVDQKKEEKVVSTIITIPSEVTSMALWIDCNLPWASYIQYYDHNWYLFYKLPPNFKANTVRAANDNLNLINVGTPLSALMAAAYCPAPYHDSKTHS